MGSVQPKLTIEHILEPFGFDGSRRTKLVRHQEQGIDIGALVRAGQFEFYQTFQGRPVFANCEQIISLLGGTGTQAVFFGVYNVLGVSGPQALKLPQDFLYPNMKTTAVYVYELVRDKRFDALRDRLVIEWGTGTRSWFQKFRPGDKEVVELLPAGYVKEFPGFLNFVLRYDELKAIIGNQTANREWHRMLGSVAGVYLILDTVTGKQYVGSAYGAGGIIGRWAQYARNGHGKNTQLKSLLAERPGAMNDFQFSVLQTLPTSLTNGEVIAYEQFHKLKLGTRAHGLNSN